MSQRRKSNTGYYHVGIRSAGQIALFESDDDRKMFLRFLRIARDEADLRILAWVLMTDHFHILVDCGESSDSLSSFMYLLDKEYAVYFNRKTGRSGHLFKERYWSKPITTDEQLIATVHYIHMNPETAGIEPMRNYRWSSYQEYAGKHWVVDTSTIVGIFGSFEAFDAYEGSSKDVVRQRISSDHSDNEVLDLAIEIARCSSSDELRSLPIDARNRAIKALRARKITIRAIARAFGIGPSTVYRILKS